MTVRFIRFWNGNFPTDTGTFTEGLERQLIAADLARDVKDISLPAFYQRPEDSPAQTAFAAKVVADIAAYQATLP
jgi:hypothetical protein